MPVQGVAQTSPARSDKAMAAGVAARACSEASVTSSTSSPQPVAHDSRVTRGRSVLVFLGYHCVQLTRLQHRQGRFCFEIVKLAGESGLASGQRADAGTTSRFAAVWKAATRRRPAGMSEASMAASAASMRSSTSRHARPAGGGGVALPAAMVVTMAALAFVGLVGFALVAGRLRAVGGLLVGLAAKLAAAAR